MPNETTIRARIRIAVWPDGRWTAYGDEGKHVQRTLDELLDASPGGESYHWIEANVPLPATVEGVVTND